jgi:hypothetical protein
MLYCRCLHCDYSHRISATRLREHHGLLMCAKCGKTFDALTTLSDQAEQAFKVKPAEDFLLATTPAPEKLNSKFWLAACLLSLALLAGQILFLEGDNLLQLPVMRENLETLCGVLPCRAPPYRNLAELTLSHGGLEKQADNSFIFSAALTNEGEWAQAYPRLKLSFSDFNGQLVAERIFAAENYAQSVILYAGATVEVRLQVVAPLDAARIGGYQFSLL